MPELPEVETIVKELKQAIVGRTIQSIEVFRPSVVKTELDQFMASTSLIKAAQRRGKFILIELEPQAYLIFHLRMTGKLVYSKLPKKPHQYDRIWFKLDGEDLLSYQDTRCLGHVGLYAQPADCKSLSRIGIEPISTDFSKVWLYDMLQQSTQNIKHWLMDQSKIAGLGNIYVAEILFDSKISPLIKVNSVSKAEAHRLYKSITKIIKLAIGFNGTTIKDFRRVDLKDGNFQHHLKVYGKQGLPCAVCNTLIMRIVQQQRSTFYCPTCQTF